MFTRICIEQYINEHSINFVYDFTVANVAIMGPA